MQELDEFVVSFKLPLLALLFAQVMQADHGLISTPNLDLRTRLDNDIDRFLCSSFTSIKLHRYSNSASWWDTSKYSTHVETAQDLHALLYGKKGQTRIGEYIADVLHTGIQMGALR